MLHKSYKSQNAHKKSKRLKFQSLEPRMVFDGGIGHTVEVGLDSRHLLDAMLNDARETEESLDIRESTVTWKENPDHSVRGKNDFVALAPSITLSKDSAKIKQVHFILMKKDQLKAVYNETYKEVAGYSDLFKNIKWNKKIVARDLSIFTLSASSNASPEAWQAVLRSIMFSYEGDNPESSREITIEIKYQDGKYEDYVVPITMQTTDDALAWKAQTNRLRITDLGVPENNIFSSVFIKDPDDVTLTSVIVRLNNAQSGDKLVLREKIEGLTVVREKNGRILRLTGSSSLATYENALKALRFRSNSEDATVRNIDIEFHKGDIVDTKSVSLAFNKKPSKKPSIEGIQSLVYTESDDSVAILPNVTLVSDNAIRFVIIRIVPFIDAESWGEALSIENESNVESSNITQMISPDKHVITFSGVKTVKEYEALLRKVHYKTKNLVVLDREIQVKIQDEHGVEKEETIWLRLEPRRATWAEKADSSGKNDGVLLFPTMKFTEESVASIQIDLAYEDGLWVRSGNGDVSLDGYSQDRLTGRMDSKGVYTITGNNALRESWQSLLRSLVFNHEGNNPTNFGRDRVIFITESDSDHKMVRRYSVLVAVKPVDDPMILQLITNNPTLKIKGAMLNNIFHSVFIEDPDDQILESVLVRLKNPQKGDEILVPYSLNQEKFKATPAKNGQSVMFEGWDTFAVYANALKTLEFKSNSEDTRVREIEIEFRQLKDRVVTKTVFLSFNKEPSITGIENLIYKDVSDAAVTILPKATLVSDDLIRSVTLTISGCLSDDALLLEDGLNVEGITQTITDFKNEIKLTGVHTAEKYEQILRKVRYKSGHIVDTVRMIQVRLEDERGVEKVETFSLRVKPQEILIEKVNSPRVNDGVLLFPTIKFPEKSLHSIELYILNKGYLSVRSAKGDVLLDGYSHNGLIAGRNSLNLYTIDGRDASRESWESLLRSLVFNYEGDDLAPYGNTLNIHLIGRDSEYKAVELPVDDLMQWEAKTNNLKVTSDGVVESNIFDTLVLDDPDISLDTVVVQLKNPKSGDTFFVPDSVKRGGVCITPQKNGQTFVFSGLKSLSAYQHVLRGLQFKSSSQDLETRNIDIEFHKKGIIDSTKKKTVSLFLHKELLVDGIQPIFYKAGLEESVAILPSVTLNASNLRSVTIKMVKPLAGDVLSIADGWESEAGGIILGKKTTETEIRLRGVKAAQDYEKILRKIHYKTTQRDFLDRTIKIIIQDEHGEKKEETLSLRVEPHVEWTEKLDSRRDNDGVPLFPDLIFSEKSIASIEIDGILGEDRLQVRSSVGDVSLDGYKKGGFVGRMHQSMGLYIITGSGASPKSWERLLRSLVFNHEGDNPTGSRKISVVVRDAEGFAVGKTYGVSVALKPVDDGIQWKAQTNRLTVTPDGVSAAIFESLVLEDPDTENVTLSSMVIRLKDGQSEDSLVLVDQKGLRVTLGQNNQELKLEGVRDLSVYRDVLQGLQFKSASQDLTSRKIEFELFHSNGMSTTKTLSVSLNQEPSVSGVEKIESSASGSDGVSILPKVEISSDDWISLMKITLVNPLPGDRLFMEDGWEKEANGIIFGKKGTDQHIRFRGLGTAQDYERFLQKIYYKNTDSTPAMLEQGEQRQLKIITEDEYGLTKIQTFFL